MGDCCDHEHGAPRQTAAASGLGASTTVDRGARRRKRMAADNGPTIGTRSQSRTPASWARPSAAPGPDDARVAWVCPSPATRSGEASRYKAHALAAASRAT